jgi:hypothetical protein
MMDQQIAPRLGADLFLLHAPSVYDFRERDDMLFAYLSDSNSVNVTSVYEMYPIGWFSPTIVATFMFRHSAKDQSAYPQIRGVSNAARFQDIYWHSLAVSLGTCRRLNPHVQLAVYTNMPGLPIVDGVALEDLFADLAVAVRVLPWRHASVLDVYREEAERLEHRRT